MRSLRFLVAVALAAMLALAQQAGLRHAFSHVDGKPDTTPQKHHPAEKVCDQCLVFATVHGGATHGPLFIPFVDSRFHFHSSEGLAAVLPRTAPYRSRAPPAIA